MNTFKEHYDCRTFIRLIKGHITRLLQVTLVPNLRSDHLLITGHTGTHSPAYHKSHWYLPNQLSQVTPVSTQQIITGHTGTYSPNYHRSHWYLLNWLSHWYLLNYYHTGTYSYHRSHWYLLIQLSELTLYLLTQLSQVTLVPTHPIITSHTGITPVPTYPTLRRGKVCRPRWGSTRRGSCCRRRRGMRRGLCKSSNSSHVRQGFGSPDLHLQQKSRRQALTNWM